MAKGERELQFATHQLVAVFLGLIALCVFVFLLGISMGSKRTALAAKAGQKADQSTSQSAPLAGSIQAEMDAHALRAGQQSLPDPVPAKGKTAPPAGKPADKTGPAPDLKAAAPAAKRPDQPAETPALKTPVEKPGSKAKPAVPAAGGWYVQVSAADDKPAAETLARKLEKDGFPVLVMDPLAKDKKALYRVRVGPYDSKTGAEEARTKLAEASRKKTVDYFLVKG